MKINVKQTLSANSMKGKFNGRDARFSLVTDEASVKKSEAGQPGRIANPGDVVISWENDDKKRMAAIYPIVAIDGTLTANLKNEALGYDRNVVIGGSTVKEAISRVSGLYGLIARTNEVLRDDPEFEARALDAANPAEDAPEEDPQLAMLASIRDAVLAQAENFTQERAVVAEEPGLSNADLTRVTNFVQAFDLSLKEVLKERNADPKDISAVNDHLSRLKLNPSITMTQTDINRVREVRALREQIAVMTPGNPEGKIYTHVVPAEKIDAEELSDAWDKTRDFVLNELKVRADMQPRHERGMSMNKDMADQTFARWTTVPGPEIMAFPISGDQRRSLVARLRNSEVEDSPNLAAVKAFREVVNADYAPEETVFKARDTVILLVDDHHGTKVYAYPAITEAAIDLEKPAFSPFTPSEVLSDDQVQHLKDIVEESVANDVREIEEPDF